MLANANVNTWDKNLDCSGEVNYNDQVESSFEKFANDTSAHGLKQAVCKQRCLLRRLVWVLAFLTAYAYLTYQLVTLVMNYYQYPFKTVSRVIPFTSLPFPTVSMCDLNIVDATKLPQYKETKEIFRSVDPDFWGAIDNTTLDTLWLREPHKSILDTRYSEFIDDAAPTINDTFEHCSWEGKLVNCEDVLSYFKSPLGRCFKFNSNASNPFTAYRSGSKGGFYAVMRVNQKGYTSSEYDAAGFKVLLHHTYDYPDMYSKGLLISPGFHYDISFQKNWYQYLPSPYRSLGNRSCATPDLQLLKIGGDEYSLSACILTHAEAKVTEICGCDSGTLIYENAMKGDLLGCAQPCFTKVYMPVISQAFFPTPDARKILLRSMNSSMNAELMRETYVTMNLFFDDLIVRKSEHVAEYDTLSILGTVGGHMGLFIGASVLTLAEMIEFAVLLFWRLGQKLNTWCSVTSNENRHKGL